MTSTANSQVGVSHDAFGGVFQAASVIFTFEFDILAKQRMRNSFLKPIIFLMPKS